MQMRIVSNNKSQFKTTKNVRQTLRAGGMRITSQRALILETIRHGQGHLDAIEVYRQVQEKQPRISLSTVYRTLQTLRKLGLIEELHFDETHHHYEMKPHIEHHHLACLECGQIVEFKYPLAQLIKTKVVEAKEFEISHIELRVSGLCAKCRQKKQ